ncbi:hypothetical protein Slin14017_G123000 [Septoria linicola]|nr:hypothetical protein Slin14017_G123000 [Septoria linicola]
MIHGRDVEFSDGGASYFPHPSTIFGSESATINTSSALYALGGPLHLVANAPGLLEPSEYSSSTLAAVTVCNVGCCGVCNQDVPSVGIEITDKTEDRLIPAANAAILDLRGRPLIHRRDVSGALFNPRQNLDAMTGYSCIATADWTDAQIEMAGFETLALKLKVKICRNCTLCQN